MTAAELPEVLVTTDATPPVGVGLLDGNLELLAEEGDEDTRDGLRIPESFFVGADLTYTYMALNGLMHWGDQKYKLEEQIRADYPRIQQEFLKGEFPEDVLEKFRALLDAVGSQPLIVRSSSLLEDNFGSSFAGKYESHFCPNQGTPEENLHALTEAIVRIYASMLNPNALLYRRAKGLQDYDERMAPFTTRRHATRLCPGFRRATAARRSA